MPADAAKMAGNLTEVGGRIAVEDGAGDRAKEKAQDPGTDDGVANGDTDGANERDHAQEAAIFFAAARHGFLKGSHRTGAHGTTEGHFPDHAAEAQGDDENEKRYEKCEAAVLADAVRKEPDAAHADSGTNAGHDEAKTAAKGITGMCVICQI